MHNERNEKRLEMTVEELIQDTQMGKPHVVILGAGASLATFPKGDKRGKQIPLMCNLVETLGLSSELDRYGIPWEGKNFEEIYSDLYEDARYERLVITINTSVQEYFSELKLPDYPTLYDHLVLSLRRKDLIATFNWDPFLYYACWRNHKIAELPGVVYLHGNVAIGSCLKDNKAGLTGTKCSVCGNQFIPSNLLFPIKQKNYSQDPFIKREWESLRAYLKHAYMLTVFGYSAPHSDVEAMTLMKDAWGNPYGRNLEQTEFIDVKTEDILKETWKDFIHTHHYDVTSDFYTSSLGLFPRRTCEAQWNSTMECRFLEQNPIPKELGFKELWEWYTPLIQAEKKNQG